MRYFWLCVYCSISFFASAQCDTQCPVFSGSSVGQSGFPGEGAAHLCAQDFRSSFEGYSPAGTWSYCNCEVLQPSATSWGVRCENNSPFPSASCGQNGQVATLVQLSWCPGNDCDDLEGEIWNAYLPPPCTSLSGQEICLEGCGWSNVSDYCGIRCGQGGVGLCLEGQWSSWSGTGEVCGPPSLPDFGECNLPDGSVDLNCVCDNNPDLCQFCQGDDCEPDFCDLNPSHPACADEQCTDPSCPEFCTNRPWHPECQDPPDFCQQFPYHPSCFDDEPFCDQNPGHVLCTSSGDFCQRNPNHPACLDPDDFCEQNPNHPTCLEPPDFCDLYPFAVQCIDPDQGFCTQFPEHDFCQDPDFCDEFPGHPWCVADWCADEANQDHPFCAGSGFCDEFPDHEACLDSGGFCSLYPNSLWCMEQNPDMGDTGEAPQWDDGQGGYAVASNCDLGPPVCESQADPVGCAILRQQWEIGCRDLVDISGLQQVAAFGEGFDSQADAEISTAIDGMTTQVEVGMLDQTGFLPMSCPPPVGLSVLGAAVEIPLQGWCDLAITVRPLVLALGGLFALLLVGRAW